MLTDGGMTKHRLERNAQQGCCVPQAHAASGAQAPNPPPKCGAGGGVESRHAGRIRVTPQRSLVAQVALAGERFSRSSARPASPER